MYHVCVLASIVVFDETTTRQYNTYLTLREPVAGNLKFVFLNLTAASNVNNN